MVAVEFLPRLRHDDPFVAPRSEQGPDPFLARAVGRSRVDQVDPLLPREIEQGDDVAIRGQVEGGRILHAPVPAEFHRAETEGGHAETGAVQGILSHMAAKVGSLATESRRSGRIRALAAGSRGRLLSTK